MWTEVDWCRIGAKLTQLALLKESVTICNAVAAVVIFNVPVVNTL